MRRNPIRKNKDYQPPPGPGYSLFDPFEAILAEEPNRSATAKHSHAPLPEPIDCPLSTTDILPNGEELTRQCPLRLTTVEGQKLHNSQAHGIYEADDPNGKRIDYAYLNTCSYHSVYQQVVHDLDASQFLRNHLKELEDELVAMGDDREQICRKYHCDDPHELEIKYSPQYGVRNLPKESLILLLIDVRKNLYGTGGATTIKDDITMVESRLSLRRARAGQSQGQASVQKAQEGAGSSGRNYEADGRAYALAAGVTVALIKEEKKKTKK